LSAAKCGGKCWSAAPDFAALNPGYDYYDYDYCHCEDAEGRRSNLRREPMRK
jgi:hypothetical protein